MEKTAWQDEKICDLILNRNFPHIMHSDHFNSLHSCVEKIQDSKKLIDMGCGNAEFGDIYKHIDYTGADLPHIIEKVALAQRPNFNYVKFDMFKDDLKFLGDYDVILINAFISEMKNPIDILSKILYHSKKYVIIHRQDVGEESRLEKYTPYESSLIATNCVILEQDLHKAIEKSGFDMIHICNSFEGLDSKKTFLLERKNDSTF